MTSADFEDLRELSRCIQSDCDRYRLNKDTPLCALHLRQQETSSAGIVEPDLEARVARIRSEDDEHPGQKKVWHEDGTFDWVDDEDWTPPVTPVRDPEPASATLPGVDAALAVQRPPEVFTVVRPGSVPGTEKIAGCWVAYHSDWSGLALFNDELEALRHAVANSMTVGWATWGQELGGGRYPSTPPDTPR